MNKKYQIFISSTYTDLKAERDLVIKSVLEMGHIPLGMEMFSAGDEEQWKLIKKQIDDCDYYVVIVAHRYGSLDGSISYTEKEYGYATSKGIPTLGFVIEDNCPWNSKHVDKESSKVESLNNFKNKIKGKLVSFWEDKNDLYGKVSIALMKQFNTNPRVGWVRASEDSSPEILKEISRLSGENASLRSKISLIEDKKNIEESEKTHKLINTLKHNKRSISFFYKWGHKWEDPTESSLLEIFNLLASELVIEDSTQHSARMIALTFRPNKNRQPREEWPCPSNHVRQIFADLNVLDLVAPSTKKHSVKDNNDYWTLTEEGKKIYKEVRREALEQNLKLASVDEEPKDEEINDEKLRGEDVKISRSKKKNDVNN